MQCYSGVSAVADGITSKRKALKDEPRAGELPKVPNVT